MYRILKTKAMQKTPLSIRVIYIITSIVYYLSAVVCLFAVIFSLTVVTGLFDLKEIQFSVEMPVEVNFNEVGNAYINGQELEIEIVEARGKVNFIDAPLFIIKRLVSPLLVLAPFLFWLVFLFHRFIRNVSEGRIFEKINFELLRKLGWSLFGFWFFLVVYMQIFKYTIVQSFTFELVEIVDTSRWFTGVLIGALFTLVLSHIFLKGMQLEEENELTI